MNPKLLRQAWPLAIAFAIVTTGASMMGGELGSDEMVFEQPAIAPNRAVPPANLLPSGALPSQRPLPQKPTPQKPNAKGLPVGKANVTQSGGTMSIKARRAPIPGTEPNQPSIAKQPMSNANKMPSPIVPVSATAPDSTVTTASHMDPQLGIIQGVTPDGGDPALLRRNQRRMQAGPPLTTVPTERGTSPGVRGSYLGLNGETATEKLIQMRTTALELERENEELRQQNAGLMSRVKESHDQLTVGVREIQLARKELTLARSDLDRLRNDLQSLRDKIRIAEREYSAVLQSMGPLLQQLLESDDVSALPPNPSE